MGALSYFGGALRLFGLFAEGASDPSYASVYIYPIFSIFDSGFTILLELAVLHVSGVSHVFCFRIHNIQYTFMFKLLLIISRKTGSKHSLREYGSKVYCSMIRSYHAWIYSKENICANIHLHESPVPICHNSTYVLAYRNRSSLTFYFIIA